jgi:hypothetical protein
MAQEEDKMENKFEVKQIIPAQKKGYVVIEVMYYGTGKTYTFVRKNYNDSAVIEGYRITFHYNSGKYLVDKVEQEYETAGKKVTNTSNKGIADSIKEEILKKDLGEVVKESKPAWKNPGEVFHHKFEMIKTCVENKIPVYLAGPAGSGKNHTLEQIAKVMDLEFYFTNSVQQEYKLTGFIDAGGKFHETEFYKAFKNGGLFFLDEMDASIPEVLVLLNAAIANGYFEFPNGKVTAHEDFRVVAAGNTVGSGADEAYTGRMVLDQATLDRFAIIEFGYDLKIELSIAKGNTDLVTFIEDLRKQADEKGIRATFSYRCISMVVKLEATGMSIEEIIKIAVVKGMDKDTINTFNTNTGNKYSEALYKIKKAA